jgi:hypothetical protein
MRPLRGDRGAAIAGLAQERTSRMLTGRRAFALEKEVSLRSSLRARDFGRSLQHTPTRLDDGIPACQPHDERDQSQPQQRVADDGARTA